jgi:hypothetical protein
MTDMGPATSKTDEEWLVDPKEAVSPHSWSKRQGLVPCMKDPGSSTARAQQPYPCYKCQASSTRFRADWRIALARRVMGACIRLIILCAGLRQSSLR